jgi:hypothetical protein
MEIDGEWMVLKQWRVFDEKGNKTSDFAVILPTIEACVKQQFFLGMDMWFWTH